MNTKLPLILTAVLLGAFSVPAATNQPETAVAPAASMETISAMFNDPVIARAKGVEIKRSQLEDTVTNYKVRMAERKQPISEAQRARLEKQLLEDMIVAKLLLLRAQPDDKAQAKIRTDQIMGEARTNAGSEQMLKRQLKLHGTTVEKFSADVLDTETARTVMEHELKSKINISDAQVRDFYDNGVDAVVRIMQQELQRLAKDPTATPVQLSATKRHIDDLKKTNVDKLEFPERVRVSHVLIATRDRQTEEELSEDQKRVKLELARKVLAQARSGENFTNLIEKYSEDRNISRNGGEYLLTRNEPFAAEFKAAAFSLTNSQISDIVTTVFGYHIIKQLERIPAKKIDFEKASVEIRKALLEQEFDQRMPEYFDQLKKESGTEILDPKYKFSSPDATELIKPAPAGQTLLKE